jgi:hypothetical protein
MSEPNAIDDERKIGREVLRRIAELKEPQAGALSLTECHELWALEAIVLAVTEKQR